jgi:hypothetical protein
MVQYGFSSHGTHIPVKKKEDRATSGYRFSLFRYFLRLHKALAIPSDCSEFSSIVLSICMGSLPYLIQRPFHLRRRGKRRKEVGEG